MFEMLELFLKGVENIDKSIWKINKDTRSNITNSKDLITFLRTITRRVAKGVQYKIKLKNRYRHLRKALKKDP